MNTLFTSAADGRFLDHLIGRERLNDLAAERILRVQQETLDRLGHLLLSTLHTNTAAAAVTRLLEMGLDDYLLTSTLHLILGQRLVRKLCERCREPYNPAPEDDGPSRLIPQARGLKEGDPVTVSIKQTFLGVSADLIGVVSNS